MSLIDAVGGGVAWVIGAPGCLGLLPAGGLAFGISTASLAVADARIRIEPPKTDPAGALPGLGHARSSAGGGNGQLLAAGMGNMLSSGLC